MRERGLRACCSRLSRSLWLRQPSLALEWWPTIENQPFQSQATSGSGKLTSLSLVEMVGLPFTMDHVQNNFPVLNRLVTRSVSFEVAQFVDSKSARPYNHEGYRNPKRKRGASRDVNIRPTRRVRERIGVRSGVGAVLPFSGRLERSLGDQELS